MNVIIPPSKINSKCPAPSILVIGCDFATNVSSTAKLPKVVHHV